MQIKRENTKISKRLYCRNCSQPNFYKMETKTGLGYYPGLFDGNRFDLRASRVVLLNVGDSFVDFHEGEQYQSRDEEENK